MVGGGLAICRRETSRGRAHWPLATGKRSKRHAEQASPGQSSLQPAMRPGTDAPGGERWARLRAWVPSDHRVDNVQTDGQPARPRAHKAKRRFRRVIKPDAECFFGLFLRLDAPQSGWQARSTRQGLLSSGSLALRVHTGGAAAGMRVPR